MRLGERGELKRGSGVPCYLRIASRTIESYLCTTHMVADSSDKMRTRLITFVTEVRETWTCCSRDPCSFTTFDMTDKANNWYPPTPQSVLAPVPGHKQQLPPSFALPASSLPPYQQPSPDTDSPGGEKQQHRPRSESLAYLLNPETDNSRTERATPSSLTITAEAQLTGPVFGYFESLQQGFQQVEASGVSSAAAASKFRAHSALIQQDLAESPEVTSLASNEDDEDQDPSYTSSGSRKRPRREAAVTASRLIPRQPSPFELSPPPSRSGSGGVASSNRKVSHSLIERRRRERINDCLGHLKQVVPQCRAEGEKKVARAKERGRKRGKKGEDDGGDDGQRGGLHKLEILQVSYCRIG